MNYDTKKIANEERYIDFDEDSECYGIFGVDSGFCYGLYASERMAKDALLLST